MALVKAKIINEETKEELSCLFNPTEYTISKAVAWDPKQQTGKEIGRVDFTGGSPRTLQMELFFDVFEEKDADVRTHVNKLWNLVTIEQKTKNAKSKSARPPQCTFIWGGGTKRDNFRATITNLSVRYTLFRSDGKPARAVCSVTFQETDDDPASKKQNPTSGSEPGLRIREVRPRDTLPWIAYEEYGDATLWRTIADANAIDDPLGLTPGMAIKIPAL